MQGNYVIRMLVRAFGLFLCVQTISALPKVIYTLAASGHGNFVAVFFLGFLPYVIPPIIGMLLFWNPDVIFRDSQRDDVPLTQFNSPQVETVAITLLGLYYVINGIIDFIFQASLAVVLKQDTGRFYNDYGSIANTVSAIAELVVGWCVIYFSATLQSKFATLRLPIAPERPEDSTSP